MECNMLGKVCLAAAGSFFLASKNPSWHSLIGDELGGVLLAAAGVFFSAQKVFQGVYDT